MKKNTNQLSIFDIAFPVVKEEPKDLIVEPEVKTGQVPEQEQNLCPYKVPTIEDIIKRINASVYRFDKHQLISDVFECGAITISNMVDLMNKEEREKRYLQVIKKYQKEEQTLIAEIFAMIFALLSSVVYDSVIAMKSLRRTVLVKNPLSVCKNLLKVAVNARLRSLSQPLVFRRWEDTLDGISMRISTVLGRILKRQSATGSILRNYPISGKRCTTTFTLGMRTRKKKNFGVRY